MRKGEKKRGDGEETKEVRKHTPHGSGAIDEEDDLTESVIVGFDIREKGEHEGMRDRRFSRRRRRRSSRRGGGRQIEPYK